MVNHLGTIQNRAAILQHADTIDDSVDTIQMPFNVLAKVGFEPVILRIPVPGMDGVARTSDNLMAGGREPGGEVRTDEAVGSGDENTH